MHGVCGERRVILNTDNGGGDDGRGAQGRWVAQDLRPDEEDERHPL